MRRFALALLLLPAVSAVHAVERDIVRKFTALPGCSLSVETFRGSVTINEADTQEIRVAIHLAIGADDPGEAEQLLQALQLDISSQGPAVRVSAKDPQQTGVRFVWNDNKQLEPTYRITVPRRCDIDVHTRNGLVIVGNVEGAVKARSDSGDVFFRHIRGSANAYSAMGDVVISHCDGPISAETRLGTVRIGVAGGPCTVTSRSGDVEVEEAKADVVVYDEAGTAAVTFAADFAGRAEIRTSGGPILAALDPKAACEIDASTSLFAHVSARLPLDFKAGKNGARHIVASRNGGGNRIVLRASGGDVRIVRGETRFEAAADVATH
jgi:hypothetical protein